MMNDLFVKLWKPSQKEGELTQEEFGNIIKTVDELIEKYKDYTCDTSVENEQEVHTYMEAFALNTLSMITANEEKKQDEQKKLLDILNGAV